MKPRPARSFERALQQIISGIGVDAAAEAVGRSASLVRKWSDQDAPTLPSIKQALALDEAYVLLKKEPAPINSVYEHRLEKALETLSPGTETLVKALFSLHAAIGGVTRTLAESMEDTEAVTALKLSPRLRNALLEQLAIISEETSDLERAVKAN